MNTHSTQHELQRQAPGIHSMLGLQLGTEHWLVEMTDIGEVLPLPPLTAVPLAKPWYCGVADIRGQLYSISDLSAFLGNGETPRDGASRVLLINPKYGFNVGLLVGRVLGLRDTGNWHCDTGARDLLYQDEQGRSWHKLDLADLLQRPDFLQIGN